MRVPRVSAVVHLCVSVLGAELGAPRYPGYACRRESAQLTHIRSVWTPERVARSRDRLVEARLTSAPRTAHPGPARMSSPPADPLALADWVLRLGKDILTRASYDLV